MKNIAPFVKIQAKPGKRDEVKQVWEKYVKSHSESEKALKICCYCYAMEDENTICLFEFISDPSILNATTQSDWFAKYHEELKPLIAAPPEVTATYPVWTKGISIE